MSLTNDEKGSTIKLYIAVFILFFSFLCAFITVWIYFTVGELRWYHYMLLPLSLPFLFIVFSLIAEFIFYRFRKSPLDDGKSRG